MCSTAMYCDVSEHNITPDVTVFRDGEFSLNFFREAVESAPWNISWLQV